MSIEQSLATLAINTGRIADALETQNKNNGIVGDVADTVAPGTADEDKAPPASKKVSKKKKKASKKTAKKKNIGKKAVEAETSLTLKDDVRPLMIRLKNEVSGAAVKSLLKKYGASTLQQLEPSKFERVIADAQAELGVDPDDDDDDLDEIDDLDVGDDLEDDDL